MKAHKNATRRQEHSGTVDANTPFVQYDYSDGGSGGVAKYNRLEKVTYPDGREVNYDYGTAGAIDDIMSRLASIKDDDGSTVLASYKYLGARRIVTEDYEDIEVNLDYNANDNLGGLDRFGRVADQVWNDYGATPDVSLIGIPTRTTASATAREGRADIHIIKSRLGDAGGFLLGRINGNTRKPLCVGGKALWIAELT